MSPRIEGIRSSGQQLQSVSAAYFFSMPTVVDEGGLVRMFTPRWKKLLVGGLVIALGVGIVFGFGALLAMADMPGFFRLLPMIVGWGFVFFGLLAMVTLREAVLDPATSTLMLRKGLIGMPRETRIDAAGARTETRVGSTGRDCLLKLYPAGGKSIDLARGSKRNLQRIADLLDQSLRISQDDRTAARTKLPDGQVIAFSKLPIGTSSSSGKAVRLHVVSDQLARTSPTLVWRMLFLLPALLAGGLFVLLIPLTLADGAIAAAGTVALLTLPLMVVGGAGALGLLSATARLDKTADLATLRGWVPREGGAGKTFPLSQIAAVQLTRREASGSFRHDDTLQASFMAWQLILVLRDGGRVRLMSQGDEMQVRSDAGRLGEFLDVPVVDSTAD